MVMVLALASRLVVLRRASVDSDLCVWSQSGWNQSCAELVKDLVDLCGWSHGWSHGWKRGPSQSLVGLSKDSVVPITMASFQSLQRPFGNPMGMWYDLFFGSLPRKLDGHLPKSCGMPENIWNLGKRPVAHHSTPQVYGGPRTEFLVDVVLAPYCVR